MRIRHNESSAFAWRAFSLSAARADSSAAKLASGSRINTAGDDAAGLSISERFRSQFMSMAQANRNAADGLSLVNTADATLQEVLTLLHRGRELSVQSANQVYETKQKQSLQVEVEQLLTELDRIVDSAEYNRRKLFAASGSNATAVSTALAGLRTSWMSQPEALINSYFGLSGDGTAIRVALTSNPSENGKVTGNADAGGKLREITVTLDPTVLATVPDADRIVARALTQVVLARNSNFMVLSNNSAWFVSGVADLIAGGDDLLARVLSTHTAADIVNAMATPWVDDELHQASAYLAARYMQAYLPFLSANLTDPFAQLKAGNDIGAALQAATGMDEGTFKIDFLTNGEAFLNDLITNGFLADPDVGGVNPGDKIAVIPDGGTYTENPTTGFQIEWHGIDTQSEFVLHIGPRNTDAIKITLPSVSTAALELLRVDVVKEAEQAIDRFDQAIRKVTTARTQLGSTANTLEHTISSNQVAEISMRDSFSRIRDADYARELLTLTKQQMMVQSSSQVLSKANRLREHTAWLLSGIKTGAFAAS